jgi:hypothetical protein
MTRRALQFPQLFLLLRTQLARQLDLARLPARVQTPAAILVLALVQTQARTRVPKTETYGIINLISQTFGRNFIVLGFLLLWEEHSMGWVGNGGDWFILDFGFLFVFDFAIYRSLPC